MNTVILGKTNLDKLNKLTKCFETNSGVCNLVNKTSLTEMLSVLNMSKFYIGPDSGTLHIARMVDTPIIGLYATSNPQRTGPYQRLDHVVDKYRAALEKFSNSNPKNIKWGERVRDPKAMSLISINDVKLKNK